jgi:hypothetical protein
MRYTCGKVGATSGLTKQRLLISPCIAMLEAKYGTLPDGVLLD